MVGGTWPSAIAFTAQITLQTPAAEMVGPIWPLFEDTIKRLAYGPNARLMAAVSMGSFLGVEVPCASMQSTSSGPREACRKAIEMACASALPSGEGSVSVWEFRLEP